MKQFVEVEETIISQREKGIAIGHIQTVIFPWKITSLRSVNLPSDLQGPSGVMMTKIGTAIHLSGGDQVLVAISIDEVKKLIDLAIHDVHADHYDPDKIVNVDGEVVEKEGPSDDRAEPEPKTILFPGRN
jgi:hypothetical protein